MVFAMTSVFSWQNSINLWPSSFCTPRPSLPVTPGVSSLPFFCIPVPYNEKDIFLCVCVTICKIDSQLEFAVWFKKLKQGALHQPRGVGWEGKWERVSKGRRYMYTRGLFMLRFNRKQQNSVK